MMKTINRPSETGQENVLQDYGQVIKAARESLLNMPNTKKQIINTYIINTTA